MSRSDPALYVSVTGRPFPLAGKTIATSCLPMTRAPPALNHDCGAVWQAKSHESGIVLHRTFEHVLALDHETGEEPEAHGRFFLSSGEDETTHHARPAAGATDRAAAGVEFLQLLFEERAAIRVYEAVGVTVGEPDAGGIGERLHELDIIGLLRVAGVEHRHGRRLQVAKRHGDFIVRLLVVGTGNSRGDDHDLCLLFPR